MESLFSRALGQTPLGAWTMYAHYNIVSMLCGSNGVWPRTRDYGELETCWLLWAGCFIRD